MENREPHCIVNSSRSTYLGLRVNRNDYERLRNEANTVGIDLSKYCRMKMGLPR
jgi:hypothetical protein